MLFCPHCHKAIIAKSFGWDYDKCLLVSGGEAATFTSCEADLINLLVEADGHLIPTDKLISKLYGLLELDGHNCLGVTIRRIRQKLPDGVQILFTAGWLDRYKGGYWIQWQ